MRNPPDDDPKPGKLSGQKTTGILLQEFADIIDGIELDIELLIEIMQELQNPPFNELTNRYMWLHLRQVETLVEFMTGDKVIH